MCNCPDTDIDMIFYDVKNYKVIILIVTIGILCLKEFLDPGYF